MSNINHYDFIIAGAGASGLSLLWQMLNSSLKKKRILVVDQKKSARHDKTWCFWDLDQFPFTDLIQSSWNTLRVISADTSCLKEKPKTCQYHSLRSNRLQEFVIQYANSFKNVKFVEQTVSSISLSGNHAVLKTEYEEFSAEYIFQSVFKPSDHQSAKVDIALKQHFKGWEIETKKNIFNPDIATLMDFDIDRQNGFSFFYQLPVSENRCLIEYTLFTENILFDKEYDAAISRYISDKFGLHLSDYEILRTEFGVIPMEDRRYSSWYNRKTLNIGTTGGWTKPSTGYTFSRIQRRCRNIVKSLEKGERPEFLNSSAYRFRVYDMLILYLIKNYPDTSVNIFVTLFKTSGFDKILTFLDEKTTFIEELGIFKKLSYKPFFLAIYKMKHRILTGA